MVILNPNRLFLFAKSNSIVINRYCTDTVIQNPNRRLSFAQCTELILWFTGTHTI
jgi:hypothetical protein